jgi:hypothetical protein
MVIQMVIREITDAAELRGFRDVDGVVPDKVIFLERTKRTKGGAADSTVKCKSVIMYTAVPGGTFVSHVTVVVNSTIPSFVAAVVNNFTGSGAAEAAETALKTTRYMHEQFGDSRLANTGPT